MKTPSQVHLRNDGRRILAKTLVIGGLVLLIGVVFSPVVQHQFVNYDDDIYVVNNTRINKGFSFEAVRWAATSMEAANWHPLTWLSHLIDVQFFGLAPAGHHLVSVLFHGLNTILLFLLLSSMTGSTPRSGIVAALFAVHPQHVESVAWVAERKDVLSALFWLLTTGAYLRYVRAGLQQRRRRRNFIVVCLFFLLGLMSKPMVITLPFVLLLLDYWPLSRVSFGFPSNMAAMGKKCVAPLRVLVVEKVPLFMLSGLSIAITYVAQRKGGAVSSIEGLSVAMRLADATVGYVKYLAKTFWPTNLVILYPLPDGLPPAWQIAGACALLVAITGTVAAKAGRFPAVLAGWLWFLGMLVPVIGLVQIGVQHIADRYTYLPTIGLFIAGAWAMPEITKRWRGGRGILSGAALILLASLSWLSRQQVAYWKDSETLFAHELAIIKDSAMAHDHLGAALAAKGDQQGALAHYLSATKIDPGMADVLRPRLLQSYVTQGDRLMREGRPSEAVVSYRRALDLSRTIPSTYNKLGVALARQGKEQEAIASFLHAIELDSAYAEAHFNVAVALERQGRLDESIAQYQEARRLNPNDGEALTFLRRALEKKQHLQ